ncbi:hypothetical protein PVAND_016816 [Polypedilum vanderplanki]|uniref:Uncharacterized protein n=1 Tax=Polypedilum vanderplanki TaxID=319348 RepID=A0A9J6BGR5_POLVA|nr:hypothetical protein PVAND_016816 [Polypedilum vanderplanki]
MKIFLFFFCMIAKALSSDDCSIWSPSLPTLQECCNIPTIFHFSTTYDCIDQCKAISKESSSLCVAECYVKATKIIEDGKINKAAIFHSAYLDVTENPWTEVINASLDKCERSIENLSNIEEQLIAILTCINKEASKDCIEFKSIQACSKVEKIYENCHRQPLSCDTWPKRLSNSTILNCCNKPKLMSQERIEKCKIACTFAIENWKCSSKCLYEEIKVFDNDGNLNVTALKEILDSNHDSRIQWSNVIDESVEKCLKLYKEKYLMSNISDPSLLPGLMYCIEWEMSARCVDINDVGINSGCYGFKKFKEQCPDTLPIGPF